MTVDEIRLALARALPLRPPEFESDTHPREKVSRLEDYLLHSAVVAAELEEALHWVTALIKHFATKIERITGYESALVAKPRDRITQADVNDAKRIVDPVSFEAGAEARQLKDSITRQIDRLRFEEQWIVSRAYSMISGS